MARVEISASRCYSGVLAGALPPRRARSRLPNAVICLARSCRKRRRLAPRAGEWLPVHRTRDEARHRWPVSRL